jgi:hypothetical protein
LAIAQAKGEALTPVQLQKILFLLGKEMPAATGKAFYSFHPYNYGPFDSQVYSDAELLSDMGLLSIQRPSRWAEYAVTPAGLVRAAELEKQASSEALSYLRKIVEWARSLSFQQLVRSIYKQYPEFRTNSVFQD